MARKKKEKFVEVEIDLDEVTRKAGPYWMDLLWHQWRWSRYHHEMTFEKFRERVFVAAIEEKVWMASPKMIVAGTDGSIRIKTSL